MATADVAKCHHELAELRSDVNRLKLTSAPAEPHCDAPPSTPKTTLVSALFKADATTSIVPAIMLDTLPVVSVVQPIVISLTPKATSDTDSFEWLSDPDE